MQLLATILFFIVFIQLFAALSIYLWKALYDLYKHDKEDKKEGT